MRDRRTNLYKMLGNTGLLLAIMLLLAYPRMSYSLDTSRVEILNSGYTAERGIGDVVIVWVTGRVKHTLSFPVMIKLETTVYDRSGGFLGSYSFFIADPIPPNIPRGFHNVALGHNLPAGTLVGRVDIQVIRVSQVSN